MGWLGSEPRDKAACLWAFWSRGSFSFEMLQIPDSLLSSNEGGPRQQAAPLVFLYFHLLTSSFTCGRDDSSQW